MNKKISICCFAAVVICIAAVVIVSMQQFGTKELPESPSGQSVDLDRYADTDSVRSADTQAGQEEALEEASAIWQQPFVYMIKSNDGVLVVYEKDENTVFFETDILLEDLEAELQEKVTAGIYFTDEQELYGFLESHSS